MIEQLAYELETDLILMIAKYLKTGTYGAADWRIKKLGQLSLVNKETLEVISKYKARILSGIDKEMNVSAEIFLKEVRATLPPALGRELTMTEGLRNIVTSWVESAKSETNIAMAKLAQSAGQSYVNAVSKASLAVLSGADTHKAALERAIGELDSLDAFVSKTVGTDGKEHIRRWTPEGYIATVIRSNSARAVNEMQIGVADELGTDLVEVTSHIGARPLCFPYQGKILSLRGETPGYMTLAETSYGEKAGLLGINCGHRLIPYVKGVSEKAEKTDYSKAENDTVYKESQQQRALERSIRNAKREQAKWESYGDKQKAQAWGARVKEKQANMRTFINGTDRTRRYDREQVYT